MSERICKLCRKTIRGQEDYHYKDGEIVYDSYFIDHDCKNGINISFSDRFSNNPSNMERALNVFTIKETQK